MKFIRKHKRVLLLLTLVLFFFSIFGVGSYVILGWDTRDLAAKVGKSRITRKLFDMNYRQALEAVRANKPELDITADMEKELQANILRELIIRELMNLEARSWGIRSTDREVAQDIASRPVFQTDGRFDPGKYYQFVIRTLGVLPKELEAERAKEIADVKFRSFVSWVFPPAPKEMDWLYQIYAPAKKSRVNSKEREEILRRIQFEESIATLNQLLVRLSQKYPIKTYLTPSD